MKPSRTFNGTHGHASTGVGGPDQIEKDLDLLMKMLDPDAIHDDASSGGVGTDNVQPNAITDTLIGVRTIDPATAEVYTNTGSITILLSLIAKTLIALKGTPDWYTDPTRTNEAIHTALLALENFRTASLEPHLVATNNPHGVTRAQLDTYSTSEIDAKDANKVDNSAYNTALQRITDLETALTNLDADGFSTDAERLAQLAQLLQTLADGDTTVTDYINSNFYTKTAIDSMTLGAYKMAFGWGSEQITEVKNRVEIQARDVDGVLLTGFALTDIIDVYVNNIYRHRGDYYQIVEADGKFYIEKLIGNFSLADPAVSGDTNDVVQYIVQLNKRVITPEDNFEGSLIKLGTVPKSALTQATQDEITASTTGVAVNKTLNNYQATIAILNGRWL